jgi:hypothetical protein
VLNDSGTPEIKDFAALQLLMDVSNSYYKYSAALQLFKRWSREIFVEEKCTL